ncbi:MAG: polysaccharide pyruvyl transferase family protein [Kiritimatiellae bacterium]|nr:polysaccharide pyruvyl transferase family protein [Kiritimatiellia bacterium]
MSDHEAIVLEASLDANLRCRFAERPLDARSPAVRFVRADVSNAADAVRHALSGGRSVEVTGCPCEIERIKMDVGELPEVSYRALPCGGLPSCATLKEFLAGNFDVSSIADVKVLPPKKFTAKTDTRLQVTMKSGAKEVLDQAPPESFGPRFWGDGKGTYEFARQHGLGLDAECMSCPHRDASLLADGADMARFDALRRMGKPFSRAVNDVRTGMWDVGLVANYLGVNYGSHMTQYALYEAVTAMGYSALMIDRPLDAMCVKDLVCPLFTVQPYPAHALAPRFPTIRDMKAVNGMCRVFVTGSDQLFCNSLYNIFGKFMAQGYVRDNHRKILYAGSFGHDFIWGSEHDRAEEAFYLSRFDAVSVREDSGVQVCKRDFGVDAKWVLDPVFLCPKLKYDEMVSRAPDKPSGRPYLFSYILDPSGAKEDILARVAERMGLEAEAVVDANRAGRKLKKIRTLENASAETWLAHIAGSRFVIVDSFHGMCFAIIYHRDFLAIVNKIRGETRFTSLLRMLGLEDRMVYDISELDGCLDSARPIDWERVDEKLATGARDSRNWLVAEIERGLSERRPYSAFDMADSRCDELERRIEKLEGRRLRLPRGRWCRSVGKDLKALPSKIRGRLSSSGFRRTVRWFFSRLFGRKERW